MKRFIALIFALTFVVMCFVSCNETKNEDPVNVPLTTDDINFTFYLIPGKNGQAESATVYRWNEATDVIEIPETVTYNGHTYPITAVGLGQGITAEPSDLKSVKFSKNVKTISESAFSTCPNLVVVEFSEGLETIEANAFSATSISSLTFPSTLKTIGKGAFTACVNLTMVTFNEGIETIEDSSFAFCRSLATISIPRAFADRVTNIFTNCEKIVDGSCKVVYPN